MTLEGDKKAIKNAPVYLMIVTETLFDKEDVFTKLQYAKELGKPFRVLVKDDVYVPTKYFDGIDDLQIFGFKDNDEMTSIFMEIAKEVKNIRRTEKEGKNGGS